jgi:polyisoprenoid-binding protein YceI
MSRANPSLVAAGLFGCLFAGVPTVAQTVVPAQSEIVFVSRQMGVPIEGRFKVFGAQLEFDPRRPEVAKVALTIAMASAAFGASEAIGEPLTVTPLAWSLTATLWRVMLPMLVSEKV